MVDRENMVSTYMGMGVAIPHGTSDAKEDVKKTVEHTGVIRVEGINSEGEMASVVDIIINQLRQEVRV